MIKGIFYTIDDYIITENGEVINKHNKRPVKPQKNGKGYLRVSIGKKLMFVHRLVAEKYLPNPKNLPQVNHKDGNKLNNNLNNLEWVDNKENRNHAINSKLHLCGEQCKYSKLTEKDVLYIRSNNDNLSHKELAEKFNVSKATINDIKCNRTWKQLKSYSEL